MGLPRQLTPGSQVEPVRSAIPPRHRSRHGNLPRAWPLSFASKQTNSSGNLVNPTVNPQFEANSCSSELLFNVNNYSCTNLVSLPQVPSQRYTMCSSLSFQRCLITRGVTLIALAQSFANVADIEDHAFNQLFQQAFGAHINERTGRNRIGRPCQQASNSLVYCPLWCG